MGRHNVRHQVKKQVLFLSHTTLDLWHHLRPRANASLHKHKRFSLISLADIETHSPPKAPKAPKAVQSLHRRSVPQVSGFHIVCSKCDGFVVKNGVVRNCPHQRDSACNLSVDSREKSPKAPGEDITQVRNEVQISVQPPTPSPSPSPELNVGGTSKRPADLLSIDAASYQNGLVTRPETREPVPNILCPGQVGQQSRSTKVAGSSQKGQSRRSKVPRPVPDAHRLGYVGQDSGSIEPAASIENDQYMLPKTEQPIPDGLREDREAQKSQPTKVQVLAPVPSALRPGLVSHKSQPTKLRVLAPVPSVLRPGLVARRSQSKKLKALAPVPSVLRPGYAIGEKNGSIPQHSGQAEILSTSIPSEHPKPGTPVTNESAEVFPHASESAKEDQILLNEMTQEISDSDGHESIDESRCDLEALMQNWREWSEGWKQSMAPASADMDDCRISDEPPCDPEVLMGEWRQWSESWERDLMSDWKINDEL